MMPHPAHATHRSGSRSPNSRLDAPFAEPTANELTAARTSARARSPDSRLDAPFVQPTEAELYPRDRPSVYYSDSDGSYYDESEDEDQNEHDDAQPLLSARASLAKQKNTLAVSRRPSVDGDLAAHIHEQERLAMIDWARAFRGPEDRPSTPDVFLQPHGLGLLPSPARSVHSDDAALPPVPLRDRDGRFPCAACSEFCRTAEGAAFMRFLDEGRFVAETARTGGSGRSVREETDDADDSESESKSDTGVKDRETRFKAHRSAVKAREEDADRQHDERRQAGSGRSAREDTDDDDLYDSESDYSDYSDFSDTDSDDEDDRRPAPPRSRSTHRALASARKARPRPRSRAGKAVDWTIRAARRTKAWRERQRGRWGGVGSPLGFGVALWF
ncbi:hypothetical protein EDC01DRAFT_672276 [Geopyxis carbonaria]|nr:hypothetical protein EDC01DRAFT_672276 [Geopyxis carbonaria]